MNQRFRFPLERLLSIRERRERDAALALAAAHAVERQITETRSLLAANRTETRGALLPQIGETRGVAELFNVAMLLEQLDTRVAATDEALHSATQAASRCQSALAERVRERRMLERLRDRKFADWRVSADRRDREEMDTIAQGRTRATATT